MKISAVAGEPNGQPCTDCSVRQFSVCAAFDKAELRELEHLGRHVHFRTCERVFEQEELTTSFYNLLEGVMRLYKLLPDGRRQIVDLGCPAIFSVWGLPRVTASPPTRSDPWSFAGSPEPPSPDLSRINRISCAGSTNSRSAN